MLHPIQPNTPDFRNQRKGRPTIGLLIRGVCGAPMWAGVADVARERDINLLVAAGGILQSPYGFEAQSNMIYDLIQDRRNRRTDAGV